MIEKELLVKGLIESVKGEYALGGESEEIVLKAFEMGKAYAKTRKFDNSRHYHNYQFRLDDGNKVMSSSFFNIFMSRNQTRAYMGAEQALTPLLTDDKDKETVFRLVRDQRFGINGVFKAVMSPKEPQQLNYVDFVLVIAGFCGGVIYDK